MHDSQFKRGKEAMLVTGLAALGQQWLNRFESSLFSHKLRLSNPLANSGTTGNPLLAYFSIVSMWCLELAADKVSFLSGLAVSVPCCVAI